MRVHFLGTGGFHPNERRHTACVMLPEVGVVFDAGTSTFRVMRNLETPDLQLFLSHAHLDHIFGLTTLLVPLLEGRLTSVRVYGVKVTLDAVRTHLFAESMFPVLPDLEFIELTDETSVAHGGTLRTIPLEHPGGSTGFRIDWPDRSLAYITDTVANGRYTEFIRGVDLLIHECNFPDEMADWAVKTGHSHTSQVVALAREANVGKLVLVHVDPESTSDDPIGLEPARNVFPNTVLAEDQMEIEF